MSESKPSADAAAWGDFWASNSGGSDGGCLPARWAAIEQAQQRAWHAFIADLPEGAAVLDLATGDGRVLRWMRAARGDLALTGIDLAPHLPLAPEGTETRSGVAMEDMPFDAASFDAVVSQFGFEYGDSAQIAGEIARVLRPGGRAGLMVHRGDGPILEHNRGRQQAIEWVLGEVGVVGAVTAALHAREGGPAVAAQVAAAVARLGAARFGDTSPGWEIPEALRRACVLGPEGDPGAIAGTIAVIEDRATNEIERIQSLARACARADDRAALLGALAARGLVHDAVAAVEEPSGRALADFLTFTLAC
jgi:SAM-dependent methyltransferase